MAPRKFAGPSYRVSEAVAGDEDVIHLKKTNAKPKYFALVRQIRTQFVKDKNGRVIVYTDRETANEVCRIKGWPGNIGMGEENWARFIQHYPHVLNPSLTKVPKSATWRSIVYPFLGLVTVCLFLFLILRQTNALNGIVSIMALFNGNRQS